VKHPVKTLAALAILGVVAPSAHAVSIKDDVLSLTPGIRIQSRAQVSDATNNAGQDYRIQGGIDNATNDPIDFSIRRARLYMSFKYGANWKGQLAINADNIDNNSTGTGTRATQVRYAWLERGFDMGDGMSHGITFGLNKPYNNPSSAAMSSSRELFPNGNAASQFLDARGVGVGYRFYHPIFMIAADVQNNTSATKDTSTAASAQEEEGLFYGARAEFSFSPDWFIKKRAESFLAKEGQGLNLGLSYAMNQDQINAANATSTSAISVDAIFWLNGLSAYAEYRMGTTETEPFAGGSTDVDSEFIVLQAAYAFVVGEEVLEPALRYQIIDANTDADSTAAYGNNTDTGASGSQIDIGVNYYLSGHDNKLQLAVSLWEAEEGNADATIIRLQHQINF
jgi:Phosphate-selective porin O and P